MPKKKNETNDTRRKRVLVRHEPAVGTPAGNVREKTCSLCAIGIPDGCPIIRTPRTDAKSLSIPFQFLDGSQGILTVTKVLRSITWNPRDDLEKVVLTFNDHGKN